ncbi:cytochrome P450 family protein [Ceratobasidium sp. AG-Ba]|nr:cytochrome P450 family protein [Ceratobasidium sp. AG-Ba]
MPNDENWKEFSRWGDVYGDIVYARVLNQDIVILNSYDTAVELLERRSAIYSTRPHLVMAGDLIGWAYGTALLPYGDRLKRSRKLLHDGMSLKAMEDLWPLLEREALKYIRRLADTPEEFAQHIRQTAGSIVIKLTYGYDVKDNKDHFIVLADEAVDMFSKVTAPGAFLVDTFPSLKYLPWAPFKSKAREWRKMLLNLVNEPMQFAKEQMQKGQTDPFLVMRWLEQEAQPGQQSAAEIEERESLIKWAAMSLYGGGADTTVSSILTFFAAMIYYPSVQKNAQEEIDRVVGKDRLPSYSDRSQLPYIEALYKEVLRWYPVIPLGVPHSLGSDKDDIFQGMRIPNNSMIVPNIWRMVRDPGTYRDPSIFNPERFLGRSGASEKNPEDIIFGFGRR